MASTTENYGLRKIDLTDAPPDITVLNQNWDKIDTELNNKIPRSQSSPDITNADMNQTTMVGFYRIQNGDINTPVTALAGHTAMVIPWDSNTVYQIYFGGHTSDDIYVRDSYFNGSTRAWGEWTPLDSGLAEKLDLNPAFIELKPETGSSYGGYIDFHYGGSTEDYTSRIVESDVGKLTLNGLHAYKTKDTTNPQLRNIASGTGDLTAGTSPLATGEIYVVYE